MQEILTGVVLFTGIVTVLVVVILLMRSRIVPSGNITVTVNDKRVLVVPLGTRLLSALAENDLFLPLACGGRGTCGQCRVNVLSATIPLLPIEAAHITRREAAQGVRLACQLLVRDNLAIRVPESVFGAERWVCTVRSNANVATFITELVLDLPAGECMDFRAGSYIQVECPRYRIRFSDIYVEPQYRQDWERLGLFKLESEVTEPLVRAYSLANCPQENDHIRLNVRIATPPPAVPDAPPGKLSSYLFSLRPGDNVSVVGPFGDFLAKDTNAEMIFIGGGAGMAPMRSHILDQLERLKTRRRLSFWYGARNLREAYYVEEFDELMLRYDNFTWTLALSEPLPDSTWTGHTGFIHEVVFENHLRNHPAPEDCEYYICGPPVMVDAVMHMLDDQGVESEQVMVDDFGG